MEMILAAVAGELASRSISFLINRYARPPATVEKKLQQTLLRVHVIVEEAEGRHITNQAMHQQLSILREAMHQGHYVLDTFKIRTAQSKRRNHQVSKSFISKLQNDSENLEATLGDMKEFLLLLMHCPPIIGRQPYSAYLFMDRCMFGRHMEKEQVIDFLLQPCSSLDVLPVIGPGYTGKRTLVEHVCREERVQRNFSQIVHFNGDDLNNLANDSTMVNWRSSPSEGRSLIVIELVRDSDEAAWKRLYPSMCRAGSGSKVILISRMDQVSSLGTVQALRLEWLHQEEYWYFFKVLAFGSANPCDEHPKLVPIAKKIATEISGDFIGVSLVSRLLRANLNAQFWHQVLGFVRKSIQVDTLVFGEGARVGKRDRTGRPQA